MRTDRTTPLSIDPSTFRTIGHRLVDELASLLESIPSRPITHDRSPSAVREALDLTAPVPEHGTDPAALIADITPRLFDYSLFNGHPRFFGYITASPAPIGMFADLLAAAANPNVGAWMLAPAATEIECQTVRWISQLLDYPADAGGVLVSGGNMANFIGFFAARAAKTPWNLRQSGLTGDGRRLRVYVSAETHTWIQKATDLSGLGTDAIRWIPTDAELRMDVGELIRQVDQDAAAGDLPFLVVGTGGSVSTGAIDPLPAIAEVCRERNLWFHVDGAYGGFGVLSPDAPRDLRALSLADSVAVDPHKWLYSPLEAGCALVRRPEHLTAAFSYHPPYYHFEERAVNFVDLGPQNSRGFRALKVWLALRQAGASGYRAMISQDIELARELARAVAGHPELELATQSLSITTFRYVPSALQARVGDADTELQLNALNERLLDRLQRTGQVFVSNAVVRGRYLLRACVVNFNTTLDDVRAVPEIVVKAGRSL